VLVVRYDRYGDPDVLVPATAEDPAADPVEVVIDVSAAALNSVDAQLRAGKIPGRGAPPFVLGLDVCGTIAEIGDEVADLEPGQRVIGYLSPTQGGYATKVVAPAAAFVSAPSTADDVHAAALPLAGLTALQALDVAQVRAGQRVLVHAAAGGVGHLAVQLAARRGAEVIATARSENVDFVLGLGATEVVDYTTVDFAAKISHIDVALDLVGGDYGARTLDTLVDGGILVGLTLSGPATEELAARHGRRFIQYGLHPSRDDLQMLVDMIDAGQLRTEVQQVFPLRDAAQAHEIMDGRRVRGKLILDARA
jgi:NADPH:quinone reductase-like Zn-dependent oxidoreductase